MLMPYFSQGVCGVAWRSPLEVSLAAKGPRRLIPLYCRPCSAYTVPLRVEHLDPARCHAVAVLLRDFVGCVELLDGCGVDADFLRGALVSVGFAGYKAEAGGV